MKLTAQDEYFTHQVALPHNVVATSDPNWRERYWFSIADAVEKDFVLSLGFGRYPNRDVMDGFCIAARGTTQRNLRASRELSPRHHDVAVGPFTIEVIDPLKTLRLSMADHECGLGFDLVWHASVEPVLEGHHFELNRNRVTHDLVRYVQTGRMEGEIRIGGETIPATRDRFWGVRDHSWGMRPMSAMPGDPPLGKVEWNFLLFMPIQFESFSIHIYLFESRWGRPTHLTASIMYPEGTEVPDDEIKGVTHDFRWVEGAPVQTLVGGTFTIEFLDRAPLVIDITAHPGRAYLQGGGYGTSQGRYQGVTHEEHEVWDLADAAKVRDYATHSSDHLIEARCNGEQGFGIVEYLIRRGFDRYGEALPPRRER